MKIDDPRLINRRGLLKCSAAALGSALLASNKGIFAASDSAGGAKPGRITVDLSGPGWKLWRDKQGLWRKDSLYLRHEATGTVKQNDDAEISDPERPGKWKLSDLPAAPPTGGWTALESHVEAEVSVPGTVEQYLWGKDVDPALESWGDYIGVSWWWREITVPSRAAEKRVFLDFESVNMRAEIFIDEQLVGYDCVGNTPFSVEVTDFVKPGKAQRLAVRITKPGGFQSWSDNPTIVWGAEFWRPGFSQVYEDGLQSVSTPGITVNDARGFGGILGAVKLRIVDAVYIEDFFLLNKPSMIDIDPHVVLTNVSGRKATVTLHQEIHEKATGKLVSSAEKTGVILSGRTTEVVMPAHVPGAKLWDPQNPHLYECRIQMQGGMQGADSEFADEVRQTFGFRWFDVSGIGTDATFRLNGKRIVLLSAISFGFWPVTGVVPTPEMAKKQVSTAKRLGLNMLNFHRAIGQRVVLEEADQQGLLYLEEPGGFEGFNADAFGFAQNREKLLRMIKRDRSHPSLIIYNMVNESQFRELGPTARQQRDVEDAHRLDPTRMLTWTSGGGVGEPGKPFPARLWMKPEDMTKYTIGDYDAHQTHSATVYLDALYSGHDCFYKYSPRAGGQPITYCGDQDAGELIFWGEEGSIGTPPRLQAIHDFHRRPGQLKGWGADFFERQYQGYARWLKQLGMDRFFTVDSLCQAIGEKEFYYHGRVIENIKINNVTDGYVVNGWENDKDTVYSGLVDLYRNPKTDKVGLIADYARPLYVAVKLPHKIAHTGESVTADFWMVNEVGLRGPALLKVALVSPEGKTSEEQSYPVTISGGDVYGQLLAPEVKFKIGPDAGYYTVWAELTRSTELTRDSVILAKGPKLSRDSAILAKEAELRNGSVNLAKGAEPGGGSGILAKGEDKVFVVDWKSDKLPEHGAIMDNSGQTAMFIYNQKGLRLGPWGPTSNSQKVDYVIIGDGDFAKINGPILDQVENDGLTAIVIGKSQAEAWAKMLADRGRIFFGGVEPLPAEWRGGSYFAGENRLLTGLPQTCVFNWEYQLLAGQPRENYDFGLLKHPPANNDALALHITGANIDHVVGAQIFADDTLATGVCAVPYGKGGVLLSSLDIIPYLNSELPEAHTVRKLFCNFLRYGVAS